MLADSGSGPLRNVFLDGNSPIKGSRSGGVRGEVRITKVT